MSDLVVRRARLRSGHLVDVRVSGGRIVAVEPPTDDASPAARLIDADGALLLPGLHDHHLHLLATAATMDSVLCGPPRVTTRERFAGVLRDAASVRPGGWIRAVGYHESVAGDLDRYVLDDLVAGNALRVQHRSGALWILNSAALAALDAEHGDVPVGVERDSEGRLTGRIWREDQWLRDRIGSRAAPDLAWLGRHLAARGVTGVTDATPDLDESTLRVLLDAAATGQLPQRLCLLGVDDLPSDLAPDLRARITVGPRKIVLADHNLPDLPDLVDLLTHVRRTRRDGRRPVAVHCVTRVGLVLTCVALEAVGSVPGDRIEHASVVPADMIPALRRLAITVVTQPGLVAERGDDYLRDVDPDDLDGLYRHASLLDAGIPVGLSTDAPYTEPDPWLAIEAATNRLTRAGAVLGPAERVGPEAAIDGFTTPPHDPGGAPARVASGTPADLCLLEWDSVATKSVRLTVVAGRLAHLAR